MFLPDYMASLQSQNFDFIVPVIFFFFAAINEL